MVQTTLVAQDSAARRNIRLGSLGAALEYYDFVAYLYVATLIGKAFFPASMSETLRLAETLAVYSTGMLVRPVAGVVIARIADRIGRKKLFMFTVGLMSLSTFVIGVLPTYSQVGWLAPVLLLLMRIVQGCAVGGELPGAAVFVTEHARPGRVARAGAFQQMTAYSGFLLGATAAFLAGRLTDHFFSGTPSLAWRLPFVVGGVLGLITLYLRRNLDETPSFVSEASGRDDRSATPVAEVLATYRRPVLFAALVVIALALANSTYFQFWPTYLQSTLRLSSSMALASTLLAISMAMLSMPFWGLLADRYGWRLELTAASVSTAVTAVLLLGGVHIVPQHPSAALWIQLPAAFAVGGIVSAIPGLVSAVFPTRVRQTGYSISYNVVVAVVGGPFNVVMVWLVSTLGVSAPMYVVLVACALTLFAALIVPRIRFYIGPGSGAVSVGDATAAGGTVELREPATARTGLRASGHTGAPS